MTNSVTTIIIFRLIIHLSLPFYRCQKNIGYDGGKERKRERERKKIYEGWWDRVRGRNLSYIKIFRITKEKNLSISYLSPTSYYVVSSFLCSLEFSFLSVVEKTFPFWFLQLTFGVGGRRRGLTKRKTK